MLKCRSDDTLSRLALLPAISIVLVLESRILKSYSMRIPVLLTSWKGFADEALSGAKEGTECFNFVQTTNEIKTNENHKQYKYLKENCY